MDLLNGLYGEHLSHITRVNKNYEIYKGQQLWDTNESIDYIPTKKITNYIKKLIDTRARFMFGKEPFFDVIAIQKDGNGSTTHMDKAQEKEDLLKKILQDNKFHNKLLKAYKDCRIGGRVAIKLWGHREQGLKIIFSPAQEFFPIYNVDDVDELESIVFFYVINYADMKSEQRVKKQKWSMESGRCILNEGIYDGDGNLLEAIEFDTDTGLDFIPIIVIKNGGLTGETDGISDVEQLWGNQDAYNRLTSDDIDALKFQMFGQDVITDASEQSIENIQVAPGALIDLQTDAVQRSQGNQASIERLESGFSYGDKYQDTVNRIKNDMFDIVDVPNVSLDQLKGLMTSGKSMKTLYWGLINAAEEDATEWESALYLMVDHIFNMVETYNLYNARKIVQYETTMEIIRAYPLEEDIQAEKKVDMEEVLADIRSRSSYINKWNISANEIAMLEQIQLEKRMLEDIYISDLNADIEEGE